MSSVLIIGLSTIRIVLIADRKLRIADAACLTTRLDMVVVRMALVTIFQKLVRPVLGDLCSRISWSMHPATHIAIGMDAGSGALLGAPRTLRWAPMAPWDTESALGCQARRRVRGTEW